MFAPSCSYLRQPLTLQPLVVGSPKRLRTDQLKPKTTYCATCHESGHQSNTGRLQHRSMLQLVNKSLNYSCQLHPCLCAVLSRRHLLQALLLIPVPGFSSAADASPQLTTLADGPSPSSDQAVPAVLEGKAKQAVEQALRKSVDKTKVQPFPWCAWTVLCNKGRMAGTSCSQASAVMKVTSPAECDNLCSSRNVRVCRLAMYLGCIVPQLYRAHLPTQLAASMHIILTSRCSS